MKRSKYVKKLTDIVKDYFKDDKYVSIISIILSFIDCDIFN